MGVVFPCELKKEDYINTKIWMISHLGFNCKDIHKTLVFYRDIMSCTVKFTLTYKDMTDAVIADAIHADDVRTDQRIGQKNNVGSGRVSYGCRWTADAANIICEWCDPGKGNL